MREPTPKGGGKSAGKKGGGGKKGSKKGRSTSPKGKGQGKTCFFFRKFGSCRNGKDCKWLHDGSPAPSEKGRSKSAPKEGRANSRGPNWQPKDKKKDPAQRVVEVDSSSEEWSGSEDDDSDEEVGGHRNFAMTMIIAGGRTNASWAKRGTSPQGHKSVTFDSGLKECKNKKGKRVIWRMEEMAPAVGEEESADQDGP